MAQRRPGLQTTMKKKPESVKKSHQGSGKLAGKIALITGGDSGIGRAIAVAFAKEGADVMAAYLDEHKDAAATKKMVEATGRRCEVFAGDIGNEAFCQTLVEETVARLGGLNILVNNAGEQHPQESILDITAAQLERTFQTNIFSMFYLVKAALPHLSAEDAIINNASVVAYRGSKELMDYAATKGAVVAFTRSLSQSLAEQGIRVNAVAPGPIWTPLIPSTFPKDKVKTFGKDVPLGRPGQPEEVAPAFVFLASDDASYITGQTIHVGGGEIING